MIVEGFQTLEDKDNIDEIEFDGPFLCSHKGSWLGTGYYLWDSDIQWAKDWGKTAYESRQKDFVIGRCKVDLSKECFDLFGSVIHQKELVEVIQVMLNSKKIRNEDEATIANLIQYLKIKGLFNYNSIRACDYHKNIIKVKFRGDRRESMILNQRVQICVISKKDVILRPFTVVFPDKFVD